MKQSSNEQQGRKRRPDNSVAIADKAKKFSKLRKFEDLENMPYIWLPGSSHKLEIVASSNDIREKTIKEIRKKTIRKRTMTIRGIKDSRNPRG
jgi:hypothetical protein